MRVLVTGGAGFIGSHLVDRLLLAGHGVSVVDDFDPFYAPAVKRANLTSAARSPDFRLVEGDVTDLDGLERAFAGEEIDVIVHLAARAGVRPSIARPEAYVESNVAGTLAVLELARRRGIGRLVFGSSSSVYGESASVPFREEDPAATPISPYAATKRAGELLCHTYRHLYGISVVCLRFFTVYGPRQRPDLAIHKFARLMVRGEPIPIYGDGSTERDYTYVDDILQGVEAAIDYTGAHPGAYEIVNLGESRTVTLSRLVEVLSGALGVQPRIEWLPAQPGDVSRTFADVGKARELLGYRPEVAIEEGIERFVRWFRDEDARARGGS